MILILFLGKKRHFLYRRSVEESHLDSSGESWFFAEREGSPGDVDGAALQDSRTVPTPFTDGLHQETDLKCGEGDHAAVGYDVVDDNMELMSENNFLGQGILLESEEWSKCDSKVFFCRGACNYASVLTGFHTIAFD